MKKSNPRLLRLEAVGAKSQRIPLYDVPLSKKNIYSTVLTFPELETAFPGITVQPAEKAILLEYSARHGVKCIAAFTMTFGAEVLAVMFELSNGKVFIENNFDGLVEIAGQSRRDEQFLRTQLTRTLQVVHVTNNMLKTFVHFYGDLTPEQKLWMQENTLSYEQHVEQAKAKAMSNPKTENNGSEQQ